MDVTKMVCPIKDWNDLEKDEIENVMLASYSVSAEAPNKIHFYNKDTKQRLFTVRVPPWYLRVCKQFENKTQ